MARAIMIVEMMGRPASHLRDTIEKHVRVLERLKDIDVHSISVSDPKEIPAPEGQKIPEDKIMFSTFAEVDFETETLSRLTQVMFDFMPSSIEVIEPAKVTISSTDATDLMNNISGRLHRYDELARIAGAKIKHLSAQLEKANSNEDDKDKKSTKKKSSSKKSSKKK